MALTTVKSDQIQTSVALAGSPTTTTQSASDNSTKVATTAYVETAVANLVASAPAALNTLDELAAALNDDASFSTTITNSIATKLPLAGGTLTGDLIIGAAGTSKVLQVKGTSNQDAFLGTYSAGVSLQAARHPSTGTFSNTGVAASAINLNTANTDSSITFWTSTTNNAVPTKQMTIDKSGNVGIGVATPSTNYTKQLHVHGSGTGASVHITDSNSGSGNGDGFELICHNSIAYLWNRENTAMLFGTNAGEKMRISATGLVGINDQNPDRMVSIIGDSTSGGQYPLSLDATNTDYIMEFRRSGTSEWWFKASASNFTVHQNGVGDEFSIYNGSVKVHGILGVNKAANPAVGLSVGADTTATNSYGLEVCNAGANTRFLVDGVGSSFFYKSDNAVGMKFDASSGAVNIGGKDYHTHQTSVDSLQIGYALNLYEDSYNTGTLNYAVWANNSYYSSSGGNKYMRNDEASRIMQYDGNLSFQNAAAGTADNAVTFADRFFIKADGKVGVGTTNPSEELHVNSTDSGNHTRVHITKTVTAGTAGVSFRSYAAGNTWTIFSEDASASKLYFYDGADYVMTLDSANNRVGIGTTTPNTANLEIHSSTNDTYTPTAFLDKQQVRIKHPNVANNYGGIGFSNSAGNYEWFVGANQTSVSPAIADFVIQGADSQSSGYRENMRISCAGLVTTPYNLFVDAYKGSNQGISGWTQVTYNTKTGTNNGGFDTGSGGHAGRFTAPVAGKYLVSVTCYLATANIPYIYTGIWKNGSAYRYIHGQNSITTGTDWTYGGTIQIYLAQNEYIEHYAYSNGTATLGSGVQRTSFSIYLIG